MKLVPHWRRTLTRAWSAQINYLSALLGYAYYLIPAFQDAVSPEVLVVIICAFCLLSNLLKPIKQKSVSGEE